MVEKCELGVEKCLCVGCPVKCGKGFCYECDGEPVTVCTIKDYFVIEEV